GGFNSLQVAARRPPELKAIITVCSTDDRYPDDVHYIGGCLLNEHLTWGSVLMSYNAYPPDPELVGERWRAMWRDRLEHAVFFPEVWLEHPMRDDYWKHGSVCEDYGAITCPVYAIGGWSDAYSNAIPRLLAGLKVPRKGLIGPWAHLYPHDGVPGPAIGFLQETLRWWDQWLKGNDTGIIAERLNDVAPDGTSARVTYGLLNLTHRDSHEHPKPLEPGKRYLVMVTMNNVAHAFPAGHKVRLAVSTCYWPIAWPAPQPVTLS